MRVRDVRANVITARPAPGRVRPTPSVRRALTASTDTQVLFRNPGRLGLWLQNLGPDTVTIANEQLDLAQGFQLISGAVLTLSQDEGVPWEGLWARAGAAGATLTLVEFV